MSNFNFKFIIFVLFILFILVVYSFNVKQIKEAFDNTKKNREHNIVLIGDSILNNSVYVFENESVPELIKKQLDKKRELYNFAKDGATIQNCYSQLKNISENVYLQKTSVFVSAGGNDILNSRDNISSEFVDNLFEKYIRLLEEISKQFPDANIIVLNLYYPLKPSYTIFHPAIKQWNQLLEDNHLAKGYSILRIDEIIVSEDDIVYDVEPSLQGGQKIADAISGY